jgi:creatinine amidohydrolase/Fe(II)-dependent formamide hydrolase-like protein
MRLGLIALLAVTTCALAQAPAPVFIEDLTSPELKRAIDAGRTIVLVPIGGTEQNGPHMTLGKHNARVRALAERIAQTLGNALVAPVVAYVPEGGVAPPQAHMRFPGTITVPDAAFETTLEYAARSFRLHGFRDIVLLGDHGTYQKDLKTVADRLNREWAATPVRVHAIEEYYRAAGPDYAKLLEQRGYRADEIGTHAALADTSLSLAINPQSVRTDQLQAAASGGRTAGVYGDPRRASAALGNAGADLIVEETVAAIRKAVAKR